MSSRYIALLRGINVGKAKRIAMADLRALFANLGYEDVGTILNSGNVVFSASRLKSEKAADRIEKALVDATGISARITVVTGKELDAIVDENPLLDVADNPSRLLVSFFRNTEDRKKLEVLQGRDWSPDALAIGKLASYTWCPNGQLKSPLFEEAGRLLGDGVTTRNWATVLKIQALASG